MGIGVYGLSNSPFECAADGDFRILGVIFLKLECEPAPLILGYVLGPMMEENLRRALLIAQGDPTVLITRPLSAGFLIRASSCWHLLARQSARSARRSSWRTSRMGCRPFHYSITPTLQYSIIDILREV